MFDKTREPDRMRPLGTMTHNYPHEQPANLATVASLSRRLLARLNWEWECGALGVDRHAVDTIFEPETVVDQSLAATPEIVPQEPSTLEELRQRIGDCQRCGLAAGRTQLVYGEGDPKARIVFVGEGPGRDEDLSGRPFVGQAGELLDKIIAAMGLRREQVYLCNVVKCQTPHSAMPSQEERAACRNFLEEQLRILSPQIIVALGPTAASVLLERNEPLSALRGTFYKRGTAAVMPTYHPDYLLRNPKEKRAVWEDMQLVMTAAGLPTPPKKDPGNV